MIKQQEMSIIEELEKRYLLLINSDEIIDEIDWEKLDNNEISEIMQGSMFKSLTTKQTRDKIYKKVVDSRNSAI